MVAVAALLLSCAHTKLVKTKTTDIKISVNDSTSGEKSIQQLIQPYKSSMEGEMNEVIGRSAMEMEKAQPEGQLGNFVADLVFQKAMEKYKPQDGKMPDFCLINNGGLRTSLPQGDITKRNAFELMPFENEIVVVTISGEKAKELFDYIATVGGQPVSNIKMGIQNQQPYHIYIGKESFDEKRTYKVVTSDYLAQGGDNMTFFKEPLKLENLQYKIRDAIIDFIWEENLNGKEIKSNLDGRIYEIQP